MNLRSRFCSSISNVSAKEWNKLATGAGPFLQYAFLHSLEETGCVGSNTAWHPHHLLIIDENETLIAAMPGYLKYDSYGEYVFDQGWAHAYHQHGLNYYPKWISAVPFTPVTGPRLLLKNNGHADAILGQAALAIDSLAMSPARAVSSAHLLFSEERNAAQWVQKGFLRRYSVQFQWYNYGYTSFDDYLNALTSRKRKSLRKSRQQIAQQGVTISRKTGSAIAGADIDFFLRCYQQTYLKRSGHTGYLSPTFFHRLLQAMPSNLMLVTAVSQDMPIACALFLYDESGLYGRYWGSLEEINGLHFECCYFQGIAFAIEQGLPLFNPGTQGEHKILRGFEPTYCVSAHKLFEPAFHHAVSNFLRQETPTIVSYFHDAKDILPFNEQMRSTLKVLKTTDVKADTDIKPKRNDNEI